MSKITNENEKEEHLESSYAEICDVMQRLAGGKVNDYLFLKIARNR